MTIPDQQYPCCIHCDHDDDYEHQESCLACDQPELFDSGQS